MSEVTHTPGPWEYEESCGEIYAPDGYVSVALVLQQPDWRANVRLIAAAPDLISIAQRWAVLDGGVWHVERHAREKAELLAETRAAIAKATTP